MLTLFSWNIQEFIIPSAQDKKGTGKSLGAVVVGTIHLSNTQHHWVQYSIHVSTAAIHTKLSVSIARRGEMMIISAQNQRKTRRKITQDKIRHKLSGISHNKVVTIQWETTGSYWTRVPLSAAPKKLNFLKHHCDPIGRTPPQVKYWSSHGLHHEGHHGHSPYGHLCKW